MSVRVLHGDCRDVLAAMPAGSVQCCVTSPPYYGLRDYGVAGQIGLEATPAEYIAELVEVFREVRRVLRDDGTLWLNLGDSYAGGNQVGWRAGNPAKNGGNSNRDGLGYVPGAKPKDLLMMPARVALALQADGWWLRSDIIWHKPNPMPESVTDRPTSAHEHVFLLAKSERYFWDADAVREPHTMDVFGVNDPGARKALAHDAGQQFVSGGLRRPPSRPANYFGHALGRNMRNVWTIATAPYPEAHFATFPSELAERCIKAGSKPGDTVLDPFGGAGTTGLVADRMGRDAALIELNPAYSAMAAERITDDCPLFADVAD